MDDEGYSQTSPESPQTYRVALKDNLMHQISLLPTKDQIEVTYHLLTNILSGSDSKTLVKRWENRFKVDFIARLPLELAVYILSFTNEQTVLQSVCLVSSEWRRRGYDPVLWRFFFQARGWRVNSSLLNEYVVEKLRPSTPFDTATAQNSDSEWCEGAETISAELLNTPRRSIASSTTSETKAASNEVERTIQRIPSSGNLYTDNFINWLYLYKCRLAIERNWRYSEPHKVEFISGHSEAIYCLQFDRNKIVSGSRDHSIRVWDIHSRQCLHVCNGHDRSVLCLKFDGELLVSGSSDSAVIVWSMKSFEILQKIQAHEDSVLSICLDPRVMVTGSKDKSIKIWDRARGTWKMIRQLDGHQAAVNSMVLRDDILVSGSGDRTIRIWDTLQGSCIRILTGHERGIATVAFDGHLIVSGSSDEKIKVWDSATGVCLRTLEGHEELVRSIQFDSEKIISASYDQTIKVWDLKTGRLIRSFKAYDGHRIFRIEFDEVRLISSGHGNRITLYDFSAGVDCQRFFLLEPDNHKYHSRILS